MMPLDLAKVTQNFKEASKYFLITSTLTHLSSLGLKIIREGDSNAKQEGICYLNSFLKRKCSMLPLPRIMAKVIDVAAWYKSSLRVIILLSCELSAKVDLTIILHCDTQFITIS